jgi:hypothetical protein
MVGMRGSLVTGYFAEEFLARAFAGRLGEAGRDAARRSLKRAWQRWAASLGPASSVRAIFDLAAVPLVRALGFQPGDPCPVDRPPMLLCPLAGAPDAPAVGLLVTAWGADLDGSWRHAVRHAVAIDASWCLSFNGRHVRLVDARRSYARRFIEFDVPASIDAETSFAVLWGLLRADAFGPLRTAGATGASEDAWSLVDEIVEQSSRHAAGVCRALRAGVLRALAEFADGLIGGGRGVSQQTTAIDLPAVFEQSLTIVYRILFLLFAEARALVPTWHPIYRDSYTIESLRSTAEGHQRPRGLWEAVQAISRLAHAGCRASGLMVPPFNGRLFAPSKTPLAETAHVDDLVVKRALLALSTEPQPAGEGRRRICYRELGVEQLGSVYESVLDYVPALRQEGGSRRVVLEAGGTRRKETGTFYTPRSITDYLIRRTLHPLVEHASADEILRLKVVDPAMGSGAFLVSACRYLARAYEAALVGEGTCHAGDVDAGDRAAFRRIIAQRCLFGVDVNPMAVQLARLSIWLATLASDRPLTFLDHHLAAGDSLVGASLDDLARRPPPGSGPERRRSSGAFPLLDATGLGDALRLVLPIRARIADAPDDSLAAVRDKEQALARLAAPDAALAGWKAAADLWCSCWFWPGGSDAPGRRLAGQLSDQLLRGGSCLPAGAADKWLTQATAIARERRFFHWTLEFPEVFFGDAGQPLDNPGFDAVVGNPPWDMLRADAGGPAERAASRQLAQQLTRFVRESGIYTAQSDGHPNRYQLFVERAVRLTRRGGRIGMVLPWGLASDHGCARLRRLLIDRCDTESLIGLDNADRIFPIHRGLRFLLLTTTSGGETRRVRCRFGERDATVLDTMPDHLSGTPPALLPVVLTRALIERLSGEQLAVPDVRTPADVAIVERLLARFPPVSSADGWKARFGRELNATDDRPHFLQAGRGLPIVEGKHVEPFVVDLESSRLSVDPHVAARLIDPARSFARPRLAYRDVASATNRLTLIAAVVPAGAVTTHTLFCLKTALEPDEQRVLCAVLNSFVANYVVRLRVTTHVGVAILERLPAPKPRRLTPAFQELASLAARLADAKAPDRETAYVRLQAIVACLYGLTVEEFAHILETFPLIDVEQKRRTLKEFSGFRIRASECRNVEL